MAHILIAGIRSEQLASKCSCIRSCLIIVHRINGNEKWWYRYLKTLALPPSSIVRDISLKIHILSTDSLPFSSLDLKAARSRYGRHRKSSPVPPTIRTIISWKSRQEMAETIFSPLSHLLRNARHYPPLILYYFKWPAAEITPDNEVHLLAAH